MRWCSDSIAAILAQINWVGPEEIEEIRLRVGQPLLLQGTGREMFIDWHGGSVQQAQAYVVQQEDLLQSLDRMTQSSLYAAEEDLRRGFVTLPGGHRVGITGEVVLKNGCIQTVKHISSLNIRLAHLAWGQGEAIMPLLLNRSGQLRHTLLVSPPRAGKTTLLRELICLLSNGEPKLGLAGQSVAVIDERGELAGMWRGIPTYDLGCRTDVLDGCPKAVGVSMVLRSMAPMVIAMDELGHQDDVAAVLDAQRTGVSILSTAHAADYLDANRRPVLRTLFEQQVFERVVVLSREQGPGTVQGVYALGSGRNLLLGQGKDRG